MQAANPIRTIVHTAIKANGIGKASSICARLKGGRHARPSKAWGFGSSFRSVEIVGPRGGGTGKERTVVRNEPLPPTPKPGMGYKLVDPTKNGSGRK